MNWVRERYTITGLTVMAYVQWGFVTALLYWSMRTGSATWFQTLAWGFDGWAAERALHSGRSVLDDLRKLEKMERDFLDQHRKDKGQ